MNCGFFERKLADYLKGKLSSSLSREMEEHFSSCVECNKIYKAEKIISGCMREMDTQTAPGNLEDRVLKNILSVEENFNDEAVIYKTDYVMDCGEFETYAASYIDGSLSGEKLKPMQIHLKSCGNCGKLVEAHQFVYSSLQRTNPVKAPAGFEESILDLIRDESLADAKVALGFKFFFKFRTTAAFAAAISFSAAIFVTFMIFINRLGSIIFTLTGNQNPAAGFIDMLQLLKTLLISRVELFLAEYAPELIRVIAFDSPGSFSPVYLTISIGIIIFTIWNYFYVYPVHVKNMK